MKVGIKKVEKTVQVAESKLSLEVGLPMESVEVIDEGGDTLVVFNSIDAQVSFRTNGDRIAELQAFSEQIKQAEALYRKTARR